MGDSNDTIDSSYDIIDTVKIKTFIVEQTNTSIVVYFITIILYIISFTYLFKKDSTEYIVWVLLFILNFITPIIWFGDMLELFSLVTKYTPAFDTNMYMYGFVCLCVTFLLTFIGLFMVLLKNEEVRKIKKEQGYYKDTSTLPDLKTNIREVEKKDREISIIYTTIVSLSWAMIAFHFGEYLPSNIKKDNFPFGSRIKALMDVVPNILTWIDGTIHYYSKQTNLPPLIKAIFVYILVFCAVFYGIFAKMNYSRGVLDQIEIVNMTPLFMPRFDVEFIQIRHFVIFLIAFISSIVFGEVFVFMNYLADTYKGLPHFPEHLIYALVGMFAIVIFPLLFSKQNEWFPKNRTKDIIFFFLCLLFGMVGAAPITASLELILGILRSTPMLATSEHLIMGSKSLYVYFFSLITITAAVYIIGLTEDWIETDGRNMKIFLTLLVTMTIALFVSLSVEFSVFKTLYDIIAFVLRIIMKFIAPIIMVILSIIIIVYAHKNYSIVKKRSIDKIAHKKDPVDTPDKTKKDPVKDQYDVRKMLKNTFQNIVKFVGVDEKLKFAKSQYNSFQNS
jgi:hypothetical protein